MYMIYVNNYLFFSEIPQCKSCTTRGPFYKCKKCIAYLKSFLPSASYDSEYSTTSNYNSETNGARNEIIDFREDIRG